MAITSSRLRAEVILHALCLSFHHKREQLRRSFERRKVYRNTHHELSMLTDRDLADLDISRSNIHSLASEAAYGE